MPEIARTTGLATNTVRYHRDRLEIAGAPPPATGRATPPADGVRAQVITRQRVAELLGTGLSRTAVAAHLGLSKSTVSYHARRLGHEIDTRCARRYDWPAVQRFYDAGQSVTACVEAFGFSRQTWHAAVKAGKVTARPSATPLDVLCVAGTPRSRANLKRRLVREGLKQERCEACGLQAWQGRPLPLNLHHVNGDRDDNRVANLQLLCPNCHALTATYARRTRVA